MTVKRKASPAQLRARKLFAQRAKVGAFRRKVVSLRKRRNVEQGFYDASGFHPIRASSDYDDSVDYHGIERPDYKQKGWSRTAQKSRKRNPKPPSPAQLAARAKFVKMVRARAHAARLRRGYKGLFNPAERAALRKLAMRDNPGRIRFSEADLKKYAGKIKGLSGSVSHSRSASTKRGKFKRASMFGGSGFLGLGHSRKRISVNPKRGRSKLTRVSAKALDLTHRIGERGPRTYMARQRIATALDSGKRPKAADVKWLYKIYKLNPHGQHLPGLPAKYQRMYEDVLASSGSKRIAAATTEAAFKRNNPKGWLEFARKVGGGHRAARRIKKRGIKTGYVGGRYQGPTKWGVGAKGGRGWVGRLPNPSPASVFSEFRGKQVVSKSKGFAARGAPGSLATLGKLKELRLRGRRLRFGGRATLAASGRKRLYIANVRMKRPNPPGEVDYGELIGVIYYANKPHIETGSYNYEHKFESPRPRLVVDEEGCPKIEGGRYRITEDGIEG